MLRTARANRKSAHAEAQKTIYNLQELHILKSCGNQAEMFHLPLLYR